MGDCLGTSGAAGLGKTLMLLEGKWTEPTLFLTQVVGVYAGISGRVHSRGTTDVNPSGDKNILLPLNQGPLFLLLGRAGRVLEGREVRDLLELLDERHLSRLAFSLPKSGLPETEPILQTLYFLHE